MSVRAESSFIVRFSIYKWVSEESVGKQVSEYLPVSADEVVWWHGPRNDCWWEPCGIKVMPVCHVGFGGDISLHSGYEKKNYYIGDFEIEEEQPKC